MGEMTFYKETGEIIETLSIITPNPISIGTISSKYGDPSYIDCGETMQPGVYAANLVFLDLGTVLHVLAFDLNQVSTLENLRFDAITLFYPASVEGLERAMGSGLVEESMEWTDQIELRDYCQ